MKAKITLDIPFLYTATVVPKRARKERLAEFISTASIEIPVIEDADAPIVIEAEVEYEYVGASSTNSGWKRELRRVDYRRHGDHLLRYFDANYGGHYLPIVFSVAADEAQSAMDSVRYALNHGVKSPILTKSPGPRQFVEIREEEADFCGRVIQHDRADEEKRLRDFVREGGLAFIGGQLWRRTGLPVWEVGFQYISPNLGPGSNKGERRYLRVLPEADTGDSFSSMRKKAFADKQLADRLFNNFAAERAKSAELERNAFEAASDSGWVKVIGPLPFERDDIAELVSRCLWRVRDNRRGLSDPVRFAMTELEVMIAGKRIGRDVELGEVIRRLKHLAADIDEMVSESDDKTWFYNPVTGCVEDLTVLAGEAPEPKVEEEKARGHRTRRAAGRESLPHAGLVEVENAGANILISREDAKRIHRDGSGEVRLWGEAFRVDGSPAYVVVGTTKVAAPLVSASRTHGIEAILENAELDRLAVSDWETWRRGAGMVLMPGGLGKMAARIYFRRDWESTLYIFPFGSPTLECHAELDTLGEVKRLCESALAEYGYRGTLTGSDFDGLFTPKLR